MNAMCRVLTATAFLVPAFLISSCDDKNSNPVAPSDDPTITDIEAPSFTTVGFGSKWHDPHIKGVKVRTFFEADCSGLEAKRFKSEDGAEISNKNVADTDGEACIVGVYPVDQKIKGKKLGDVKELDFSYAGGDEGAAPSMRIPIDECLEVSPDVSTASTPTRQPCGNLSFQFTDGVIDDYAYIDAEGCNDGDGNVGVVNAEDKEEDCRIDYNYNTWYSWASFVADHPNDRVARKLEDGSEARTEVIIDWFDTSGEGHYLIWMIDVR